MKKQIFMDTAFVIAVIDASDSYHDTSVQSYKKIIKEKWSVITTEAVLIEIGNGFTTMKWRQVAHKWITKIQKSNSIFNVTPTTKEILKKAIDLYGSRLDKEWGLTDCISFTVMQKYGLERALTIDHHFVQAGYQTSMNID